ncbi:MAG: thiamine pyrophosphate-dependent dehydrogenase E1 component subunit alpha [Candidatus Gorgyraea atricola]|nr:thiamine pyrophosphate-dependent dehydrogenase E1 component subunit alpha [Candidatus Gorgyraea atricola]
MKMQGIDRKTFIWLFETMLKIRMVEEKIIELYPDQEIKCPVHLCIGQEAIAAGVCANLKKTDYVFSNHRGHGHYIANGGDLNEFMAELYGRVTGCSKGKGGSMHLADTKNGFMGSSAIVGGGIPIAVGAAMGSVMQEQKRISVVFFGDGATDEGTFNESLNFAALKKLPVVFVCENNFYATNSPASARQALDNIYKKGLPYGIPGIKIDGNDVGEVFEAARVAVERAKNNKGPSLLECRTYRWKGHVGPDCDFETGCRPRGELDRWLKKCPIERFRKSILKEGILSIRDIGDIKESLGREIEKAVSFAKSSSFPKKEGLLEDVY